jgi:hypothetical protein
MVLLGGSPDVLAALRRANLADEVLDHLPSNGPVSRVIRLPGALESLDRIAALLRPGGDVLFATDRRIEPAVHRRAVALSRGVASIGLQMEGCWAAAPDVERCRRFIPLDSRAAIGWYLDTLFVPGAGATALVLSAAKLAVAVGGRSWIERWVPARCVLLRKSTGGVRPPPAPLTAARGLPAGVGTERVPAIVLSSGQDDASRVVLLPFLPNDRRPAVAVKIAPVMAGNEATVAEQEHLRRLRAFVPDSVARAMPVPLGVGSSGDLAVITQSLVPGHTVDRAAGSLLRPPRRRARDLAMAADWLTRFHLATTFATSTWDTAGGRMWLLDPLERLLPDLPDDQAHAVKSWVAARSSAASGLKVPLVQPHYDFAPVNVMMDGRQIGVVDWELSSARGERAGGLPLCDLLFFVTYWWFLLRRARNRAAEVAALEALLDGRRAPVAARRAAWDSVEHYERGLGLDPRLRGPLFATLWVERATHYRQRAARLGLGRSEQTQAALSYLVAMACRPGVLDSDDRTVRGRHRGH